MTVATRFIVATLASVADALWIVMVVALGQMWATDYWGSEWRDVGTYFGWSVALGVILTVVTGFAWRWAVLGFRRRRALH